MRGWRAHDRAARACLRLKEAELVDILIKLCEKSGSTTSRIGDALARQRCSAGGGHAGISKSSIKLALQRAIRAGAVKKSPGNYRFKLNTSNIRSSLKSRCKRQGRKRRGRRRKKRRGRRRKRRRRRRRSRRRRRRRGRRRRRSRRRSRRRRRRRRRRRKRRKRKPKEKKEEPEAEPTPESE